LSAGLSCISTGLFCWPLSKERDAVRVRVRVRVKIRVRVRARARVRVRVRARARVRGFEPCDVYC
jgi:hypothetical protein